MKKELILVFVISTLSLIGCEEDYFAGNGAVSDPVPVPTFSSFSPESGAGGVTVAIFGENLGQSISDNYVTFNGTYAEITQVQSGIIIVRVPDNLPQGDYTINVITGGQTLASTKTFKVSAY